MCQILIVLQLYFEGSRLFGVYGLASLGFVGYELDGEREKRCTIW